MFDEERDAFIVKRIIIDKHFTLIGPSIPGSIYLGPGYFYIISIFYFLSKGNPLGPAIAAAVLGSLSTLLLFYLSWKLFEKRVAAVSSIIYAVSYLTVIYNRNFWPLNFDPIIAMVTYLSLYNIILKKDFKWVIILSLALIVGVQSAPTNFSLLILTFLIWILHKLPPKNRFVLFSICLFLFSHLPLFVFDLRHNFLNTRQLIKFLSFGSASHGLLLLETMKSLIIFPQVFSRFIFVSFSPNTAEQIIPQQFYIIQKIAEIPRPLLLVSFLILLWFLFYAFLRRKNLSIQLIFFHILISLLGMMFYNTFFPGYTFEWFFQILFPAFAIVTALFFVQFLKYSLTKPLVWILLWLYVSISVVVILNAKNSYNLADKSNAVKWAIRETGNKPFSLDSIGQNFSYGGYRYLFYLYGKEPQKSYMDPVYAGWLYPKEIVSPSHPDTVVVIVNPDFFQDKDFETRYQVYLAKTIARQKFGIIEVLIVDNVQKWVNW